MNDIVSRKTKENLRNKVDVRLTLNEKSIKNLHLNHVLFCKRYLAKV